MTRYILTRLLAAAVVMLGVATVVFLLMHLIPGDPVDVMLGEGANPADRAELRRQLGLDRPLLGQWLHYLGRLLYLDLGIGIHSREPVAQLLMQRIPATLALAAAAFLASLCIAFPLGILAAVYRNSVADRIAMLFSVAGVSIPNFWLGPLLILLFSYWLGWLPVSGMQGWSSLILPALTLGTALAALQSRMIRASLLEVLGEDYIRAARARGLGEATVILQHGLRNALLPVVTILGIQLGALLTGAVVTEFIFDWPGVGRLIIDAIHRRDYPVVQACVLFISAVYVLVNLVTDILSTGLDPRMRLEA
ncbi:MAG: nickel ABC transporter permease [Gammaproteobacteria bacterium]